MENWCYYTFLKCFSADISFNVAKNNHTYSRMIGEEDLLLLPLFPVSRVQGQ
jgi:hypothetical protein